MFLFTVTKPGLRQAGALALCAVCLCGTVAAAVHFSGETVTTGAAAESGIETTQDIAEFFTGHGFSPPPAESTHDPKRVLCFLIWWPTPTGKPCNHASSRVYGSPQACSPGLE